MSRARIVAYLKPGCQRCDAVRAVFGRHHLAFEECDIATNAGHRQQALERTGQIAAPSVEINGYVLTETNAEEVEAHLTVIGAIPANGGSPVAPPESPCAQG